MRDEYPADMTLDEAKAAIGNVWSRIGFERLNDKIWTVDLTTQQFVDAVAAVQAPFRDILTDANEVD